MQVLTEQSDATAAFAAFNPVLDTPQRSATVLTALGEAGGGSLRLQAREHLVQEALQRDPKPPMRCA